MNSAWKSYGCIFVAGCVLTVTGGSLKGMSFAASGLLFGLASAACYSLVGIGNLAGIVLVLGSIAVMNMELPVSGKSMPKRVSVTSQEHAHVDLDLLTLASK